MFIKLIKVENKLAETYMITANYSMLSRPDMWQMWVHSVHRNCSEMKLLIHTYMMSHCCSLDKVVLDHRNILLWNKR